MRSWVKGLLIASAICIGTGSAVCITAWAMGGRFSYYRHRNFGFVEDRGPISAEENLVMEDSGTEKVFTGGLTADGKFVRSLEVEVTGGMVELIADDSAEAVEVIINDSRYQFRQETKDDKLELSIGLKDEFWNNGDFELWEDQVAQIRVPTELEFQKVKLELKAGILDVYDITAKKMELDLQAGQLMVTGADVQELDGECMAGELIYHGQVGQKLEAECLTGRAEYILDGKEEDFNYELEAAGGVIQINGEEKGKLKYETVINNSEAVKKAELECKMGEIYIEFE